MHSTQEEKTYVVIRAVVTPLPSDLIKAVVLGVRASFVAAQSLGTAALLPSLRQPQHSGAHLPAASAFIRGICKEYDHTVIIFLIWECIFGCVWDLRFLNFAS